MQKYRKESFIYLLLVTVILAAFLSVFWHKLYSDFVAMRWTAGILLFLFLYESMTIFIVNKKVKTATPNRIVSLYMLLKGGKIVLFLFLILIYALAVQIETKRFILVAVALYFIYLLLDTLFLTLVEKNLKNENESFR